MTRQLILFAVITIVLVSVADAANYMYEKASVKGVGYKNAEMIISTQEGFNGSKLVEKESGSGNVITEKIEVEAERQIGSRCDGGDDFGPVLGHFQGDLNPGWFTVDYSKWPTGFGPI